MEDDTKFVTDEEAYVNDDDAYMQELRYNADHWHKKALMYRNALELIAFHWGDRKGAAYCAKKALRGSYEH